MSYSRPCERCGRSNGAMCERTNPRDYSVTRIRLCSKCRHDLGISAPPTHASGKSYRLTEKASRVGDA